MSKVRVIREPNDGYVYASFGDFLSDVVKTENDPSDVTKARERLTTHVDVVRKKMTENLPLHLRTASGMSEAVPADAGFLLQPQWAQQIVLRSYQESAVLKRVTEWQVDSTNTSGLKFPRVDEQSRTDGNRWGGSKSYWMNEADALTATKPKMMNIELNPNAKKLGVLTYLTSELLNDLGSMSQYLFMVFAKELAYRVTDAIIAGDGAGKPQGVLNGGGTIIYPSRTSSNVIAASDVLNILSRFWVGSRTDTYGVPLDGNIAPGPKPLWVCHSDVITQLATCVISVGTGGSLAFLYNPETGILMGIPVVPIEQCPALGTAGDIILADFNEYHLAWRNRGQLDISMHVKFTTDEQALRLTCRVDGSPGWGTPITPANGTATQSPFVAIHA